MIVWVRGNDGWVFVGNTNGSDRVAKSHASHKSEQKKEEQEEEKQFFGLIIMALGFYSCLYNVY